MDKSVPNFHRASRGGAEARAGALFDSYCHRRWGSGVPADAVAGRRFGVDGKTIGRWRGGKSRLPAWPLMLALTFEGLDGLLDNIDPDFEG